MPHREPSESAEPLASGLHWLTDELGRLRAAGLLRSRRTVRPLPDGWCEVDGRRARNFASNDYLNLAQDPRLIDAARRALAESGSGASASALVSGRTQWHAALEERLASFEGQPAAVLFPTGYAANLGTIAALAGTEDVIYCDRFNHASLVDGCRLSGAKLRVYRHDRLSELRQALERPTGFRRRIVVTDSVFSMDGDIAPLPDLIGLTQRFDATLIVDEAHATGVLGECGRGAAEWLGIEAAPGLVRVGTLSKAVGSLGGFVAGTAELCEWLWTTGRPQMFSTAIPPSACAAAITALEIIAAEPERRTALRDRGAQLVAALRSNRVPVPLGVAGPIVPVLVGDPELAVQASHQLLEEGFLVPAIRPPTVPSGTSRLRITVTAAHSTGDVQDLAAAVLRAVPSSR